MISHVGFAFDILTRHWLELTDLASNLRVFQSFNALHSVSVFCHISHFATFPPSFLCQFFAQHNVVNNWFMFQKEKGEKRCNIAIVSHGLSFFLWTMRRFYTLFLRVKNEINTYSYASKPFSHICPKSELLKMLWLSYEVKGARLSNTQTMSNTRHVIVWAATQFLTLTALDSTLF